MVEPDRPRPSPPRPIIKEPVWTWEIPTYFFVGGLAGGSTVLGLAAGGAGRDALARRAWPVALGAVAISPVLLISDLGRPERFYNMLRIAKPTSPMSMGSWILSGLSGSVAVATAHSLRGWFPRLGPISKLAAGLLGPMLATYTAVLIADTAVPVWHEARRELPFVFASSAAASAGAAATMIAPAAEAGPARRLAVLGAVAETAATAVMERRLGKPADAYREGVAARLAKLSRTLTATGAGLLALAGRRSRAARIGGGALVLAGAATERRAIFEAGLQSARDPAHTIEPQLESLAAAQAAQRSG
jgi:Polysulphide reductase, NrfD